MKYPLIFDVVKRSFELEKAFPGHPVKCPTEAALQAACFQWWNIHFRAISVLYHVPNGGTRHPAEVIAMKAQGLRPGVPDLHLLIKPAILIPIELKNGNRPLDPEQTLFKTKVEALGFPCYKISGFYEFAALLIALFEVEPASVM